MRALGLDRATYAPGPNADDAIARIRAAAKQVVSGDAVVLDDAGAWFNLAGRVVEGIAAAKIVKLQ